MSTMSSALATTLKAMYTRQTRRRHGAFQTVIIHLGGDNKQTHKWVKSGAHQRHGENDLEWQVGMGKSSLSS